MYFFKGNQKFFKDNKIVFSIKIGQASVMKKRSTLFLHFNNIFRIKQEKPKTGGVQIVNLALFENKKNIFSVFYA